MKVIIGNIPTFQRALKPYEEADYASVLARAKEKTGNTGNSVLIVPSPSLPSGLNNNMGCGNMLSEESKEFFDFAKQYWGINYVQLLPEGIYTKKGGGYKPYSGTSLDLGIQLINPELLTEDKFGNLLKKEDVINIVNSNLLENKDVYANIENTIDSGSATEKALKKAFDELLKNDTSKKQNIIREIEQYRVENKDWLERKTIFNILKKKYGTENLNEWSEIERNLYNEEIVSQVQRGQIIKELQANPSYKKEGDFYIFKQFLADKHLELARKELNSKGIKLSGDMVIGCSYDEAWMFPKAFYKDRKLPWRLCAINYDTAEGIDFLKLKVRSFAKRYDGLRIDASWLYCKQYLYDKQNYANKTHRDYGSKILDLIDKEILSVKGKNFDMQNIMYEFEANMNDFPLYSGQDLREEVAKRIKIYKSDHLSKTWGSVYNFKKRGWEDGSYIIGTTNHDAESLINLYSNPILRKEQTNALSEILNIPANKLNSYSAFAQAKFAEPMRSKHNMIFFSDALNIYENYCAFREPNDAYRTKIPHDYKDKYFKALQEGEGFNIMDSLQKVFEAEGLDKTEPELYKKIRKYNKILRQKENPNKKFVIGGCLTAAVLALCIIAIKKYKSKTKKTDKNL